jgi:hypothetical protein
VAHAVLELAMLDGKVLQRLVQSLALGFVASMEMADLVGHDTTGVENLFAKCQPFAARSVLPNEI